MVTKKCKKSYIKVVFKSDGLQSKSNESRIGSIVFNNKFSLLVSTWGSLLFAMDHSTARAVVCVWRLHVAKGCVRNRELRDLSLTRSKILCTKVQQYLPSYDPHNPRMPVGLCGSCRGQVTRDDEPDTSFSRVDEVEAALSAVAAGAVAHSTRLATSIGESSVCSGACVPCSVVQQPRTGGRPGAPAGPKRGRPPTPEKPTPPKSARVDSTDTKQPDCNVDSDDDIYGDALSDRDEHSESDGDADSDVGQSVDRDPPMTYQDVRYFQAKYNFGIRKTLDFCADIRSMRRYKSAVEPNVRRKLYEAQKAFDALCKSVN